MVSDVTVDININKNNITLTLSWGEPFINLNPIVNYTVSCSGDVTCPPNFTTTNNTTRSYTITNLTPMTNYTFSVVATNSIGSGEAGVVVITTPGEVMNVSLNMIVLNNRDEHKKWCPTFSCLHKTPQNMPYPKTDRNTFIIL